jgi:hypothetical protein
MPQKCLQRPGIDAIARELKPAGMAEHMGMDLDAEIGLDPHALDHTRETRRTQRRPTLRHEHERRLWAFPLVPVELAQFASGQRVRRIRSVLDPPHSQFRRLEVDLFPPQVDHLRRRIEVLGGGKRRGVNKPLPGTYLLGCTSPARLCRRDRRRAFWTWRTPTSQTSHVAPRTVFNLVSTPKMADV